MERHAVITGAAGGIGQALVREFHSAGYSVIATDLAPRPADLPCALYLEADLARTVCDEGYATEVFEWIKVRLAKGRLDVLVNNAAVQIVAGMERLTRHDWRQTLDVNLTAPFLWTQALLPQLEAARGSVINISSIHARLTKKSFVAYATSKAALSGMTRALAVDLGGRVRVNAIEPAAIETEMLHAGFAGNPDKLAALNACHPCGGIGEPGELASFARTVVETRGAFLTGSILPFDGGIGAVLHDPARVPMMTDKGSTREEDE